MVTDRPADEAFAPGDAVFVPWGLDILAGTVVSTRGTGSARRVLVSIDLPDTSGDCGSQLLTLSPEVLTRTAAIASDHQPGAWLTGYRYGQDLGRALESLLRGSAGLSRPIRAAPDLAADFYLSADDSRLVIEAQISSTGQIPQRAVDQLIGALSSCQGAAGLLVANAELSSEAERRLAEAIAQGYQIRAIRWRSPSDNAALASALRDFLFSSG